MHKAQEQERTRSSVSDQWWYNAPNPGLSAEDKHLQIIYQQIC